MERVRRLTGIIERENDGYVALCPQLDVASQGSSIEEARANLIEALTLFFEAAAPSEVERRLRPAWNLDEHHSPVWPSAPDL